MCNFHSIIISATGEIRHDSSNSHSGIAAKAGWVNPPQRQFYWEAEGYAANTVPDNRVGGLVPEAAMRACEKHYKKLADVLLTGILTPPFDTPDYHDVRRYINITKENLSRSNFNDEGFDSYGFDAHGLDKDGYDSEKYGADGIGLDGFDRNGYNEDGSRVVGVYKGFVENLL